MSETREKLLERIQRLLSLSSSTPFEEEAKTALGIAERLMTANAIAMSEVEAYKVTEYTTVTIFEGKGKTWEMDYVARIIHRYFYVRVIFYHQGVGTRYQKELISFFGDEENVEVAKHVFVYLCRTFRDLWQRYRKYHRVEQRNLWDETKTYYRGLSDGFMAKLQAERDSLTKSETAKNALIRLDHALKTAERQAHPGLTGYRMPSAYTTEAYEDAFAEGKQINVRKPPTGTESDRGRLTGG
jgi:Protein of unknown function (DUF2786)